MRQRYGGLLAEIDDTKREFEWYKKGYQLKRKFEFLKLHIIRI